MLCCPLKTRGTNKFGKKRSYSFKETKTTFMKTIKTFMPVKLKLTLSMIVISLKVVLDQVRTRLKLLTLSFNLLQVMTHVKAGCLESTKIAFPQSCRSLKIKIIMCIIM